MFDPRTLYVQSGSGATYDIRAYVGRFGAGHDNIVITAEGVAAVTASATDWDEFTTVLISGAFDVNGDGFIAITFVDQTLHTHHNVIHNVGGPTGWAVVGLDIADNTVGLPAAAL